MKLITRLTLVVMFLGVMALPLYADFQDGLLLLFTFDSGDGTDSSGGGHDGELNADAEVVKDIVKHGTGALRIDGGQQQMAVASFAALDEYEDNTYLFWINFTAPATGGWDQILAKTAPGSDRSPGLWVTPEGLSIHYRYNPGNLGPWGINPTGNQNGNFFEENIWYHIAGVTQGAKITVYVDGNMVVDGLASAAAIAQGADGLYVGNSPQYGGPAASFIIDDLVVYDRGLEKDEVLEIMAGDFLAVDAAGKLTSTWGEMKSAR